ncbi:glycosyltransferase [Frigidibacter sp. SD6-1]|uniref:glycosyltransferase n=1 Tax=Frigidibacter sp. SD6-1 TaxID=3032581 RepID=UPI0024E01778|nr:glycosyltransferase [Frigidibacter sp. SD6-1]
MSPPPAVSHLRLVTADFVPVAGLPGREPRPAGRRERPRRKPLGQILMDMKAVEPGDMLKALALRDRQEVRLGDILLAHGWVSEPALMAALANQWGARVLDLAAEPPDARLIDALGPDFCLKEGVLPWRRIGAATVIATARPDEFARLRTRLPDGYGPVVMALASEREIHAAMIASRQTRLIRRAETRTAAEESCRTLDMARAGGFAAMGLAVLAGLTALAPAAGFLTLLGWACLTLLLCMSLKAAAFLSELTALVHAPPRAEPPAIARLPTVSLMVPLFDEDDIAPRLIERLGRLDYPKELLDILLVVEEEDRRTLTALARRRLPRWMRVVTVPSGPIRTKPRALNYALDFCKGTIVGVYDAEDAPEPGQIRTVVRRFHERGPEVACLQGVLDFCNSRHNWLTRCFTIEYAAWFRVMLPGIARLGFVVPLGGTTLFFRRAALEALGGWDAHNVTEDADLGVRLARHGYRTELIPTVTEEEPNGRALPWIRQRSRWLKGYAMTWAVHMRDPARLWRQLGPKRFAGFQIMFLGTLSQFVLAPVLWSFWGLAFGLGHPLAAQMPVWGLAALGGLFVLSESLNIAVGMWAVRDRTHRHLMPWVPTLCLYFPLGALASYKALWEIVRAPFFWDKTRHGVLDTVAPVRRDQALPVLVLTDPLTPESVTVLPLRRRRLIWSHPAPRFYEPPPAPPEDAAALAFALSPGGTGIEFQPRFEGF